MLNFPVLKFEKSCNYLENQLQLQNNNKERILDIINNVSSKTTDIKSNCYANILEDANNVLSTISSNISSIEKLNLELKNITGELNTIVSNKSKNSKEFYINTFSTIKDNLIVYSKNFQAMESKLSLDNSYFNEFINRANINYDTETLVDDSSDFESVDVSENNENNEITETSEKDTSSESENIITEETSIENEEGIEVVNEESSSENKEITEYEDFENFSSDFCINKHVVEEFNNTVSFGYENIYCEENSDTSPISKDIVESTLQNTINPEIETEELLNTLNTLNSGDVLLLSLTGMDNNTDNINIDNTKIIENTDNLDSIPTSDNTDIIENIEIEEEFIEEIRKLESIIENNLLSEIKDIEEFHDIECDIDLIPKISTEELQVSEEAQISEDIQQNLEISLEDELLEELLTIEELDSDNTLEEAPIESEENLEIIKQIESLDMEENIKPIKKEFKPVDILDQIESLDDLTENDIANFENSVKEEFAEEILAEALIEEIENLENVEVSQEETAVEETKEPESIEESQAEDILEEINELEDIEVPQEEAVIEENEETENIEIPEVESILEKLDELENIREPEKKPVLEKAKTVSPKTRNNQITKDSYKEKLDKIVNASEDNKTLLISERLQKIYLPYKKSELLDYIESYPNAYKSLQDVVEQEFVLPFQFFKNQSSKLRFSETYNLLKNREGQNFIKAVSYSFKVLGKRNLNPAIIASCKTKHELDSYIYYLDANNLNNFRFFDIIYEVNPLK